MKRHFIVFTKHPDTAEAECFYYSGENFTSKDIAQGVRNQMENRHLFLYMVEISAPPLNVCKLLEYHPPQFILQCELNADFSALDRMMAA